jgi:hypothetical protein
MRRTVVLTVAVTGLAIAGLGGVALAAGGDDGRGPTAVFGPADPSASATDPSVGPTDEPVVEPSADPTDEPLGPTAGPTAPPAGAGTLDADRAAELALRRVAGGRVTEIEREWEHGRLVWKVEVHAGGVEYDIRVDAATGAIVRARADDDRDGDADRDGDDDRGGDDDGHRGRGRGGDDD